MKAESVWEQNVADHRPHTHPPACPRSAHRGVRGIHDSSRWAIGAWAIEAPILPRVTAFKMTAFLASSPLAHRSLLTAYRVSAHDFRIMPTTIPMR
eukprot:scaffold2384_cov30-Phaeocystis_antarctica.AAC.1